MGNAADVDIWRDSLVRYLGYSNELVAFGYVFGDTFDKGKKAQSLATAQGASEKKRRAMVINAAVDTLLWQTLASVAIPGFTINRVVALTSAVANKTLQQSPVLRRWAPTAVGLGVIPLIIHPIDHFVDTLMDNTTRPLAAEYLSMQE